MRAADDLADRLARALDRGARTGAQRIVRAVTRAVRQISPVKIDVTADTSDFQFELSLLTRKLPTVAVTVIPKVSPPQWRRMITAALAGVEIPVRVVPDVRGFDAAVRRITTPTIRAEVEPRVDTARLNAALATVANTAQRAVGPLTGLLKLGAVGIAAASTAQSIAGLTAALAPAAGILAAGPAVILGYASALGALKLATAGAGEAFGAALFENAEKFEKSLENLPPSIVRVARKIRELRPAFDEFRESVSGAFFGQFEERIESTAKALGGPLREALSNIASEFGTAVSRALEFVSSAEGVGRINGVLLGTSTALSTLGRAVSNVLPGFLALGDVIAQRFGGELASGIATLSERMGDFLLNAANSGRAIEWVDTALTTFAQLGDIIGNIGGIIKGVFDAAGEVGGGVLNNIRQVTDSVRAFVESSQGAEALQRVFTAVSAVAANLGPIIGAIATQLGAIAPSLVPIFNAIGPAIVAAVNAVGPALAALAPGVQAVAEALRDAIETIADSGALRQLGEAVAAVATAIAPVLPVVARLAVVLGSALTPVVAALAPVLGAVTGVLADVVSAVSPLLVVVGQLVSQLGPVLTPIVTTLGTVIQALTPVISTLATTLSGFLGPVLTSLPALIQPFLNSVQVLATSLLPVLNQLLIALQPSIIQLGQALAQVAVAAAPVLLAVSELAALILTSLTPLLTPLIGLIGDLAAILAGRLANVMTGIVVPALEAVAALLRGDFSAAFTSIGEVVTGAVGIVVDVITELPVKILQAVGTFGNLLVSAGEDLIRGLIRGITNLAGNLASALKDVVGDGISAAKQLLGINSPSRVFATIGRQVGQGFINGIDGMGSKVSKSARGMAATAVSPFAGLTTPELRAAVSPVAATGRSSSPALAPTPGAAPAGAQRAAQAVSAGAPNITFNITEVGGGEATAHRVMARLASAWI